MSSPFERLWKDKMDVYGWVSYEENNITKSKEAAVKPDIKCHYSQGSLTETGENGVPTLNSTHKLFCPVGAVSEGDKVIVTQRDGKTITLTIGEGFPYQGGMQYSVKRDDKA